MAAIYVQQGRQSAYAGRMMQRRTCEYAPNAQVKGLDLPYLWT